MKNNISKADFQFLQGGQGRYRVTYTSPKTLKTWSKIITCMPFIDAVRLQDNPTKAALNELKRLVKL